jgi:hypothetical protein
MAKKEYIPKSGGRMEGEECAGQCKHSSTYHQAKWKDEYGNYNYACCRVDCPCMKYVPSGKPNTEAR